MLLQPVTLFIGHPTGRTYKNPATCIQGGTVPLQILLLFHRFMLLKRPNRSFSCLPPDTVTIKVVR
jgi:hypothetical protein